MINWSEKNRNTQYLFVKNYYEKIHFVIYRWIGSNVKYRLTKVFTIQFRFPLSLTTTNFGYCKWALYIGLIVLIIIQVEKTFFQYTTPEDVIEDKGWLRTFRDPIFIEEIVEVAISQNSKLVRKYLRNKTQKNFDPIIQTIMKRSLDVDMDLVKQRVKEKLDTMNNIPVSSVWLWLNKLCDAICIKKVLSELK